MNDKTQKVQVWLFWLMAVLATMIVPVTADIYPDGTIEINRALNAEAAVVIADESPRYLFPWLPNYRWRKMALKAYRRWQRAYRQAKRRYLLARGLAGMAQAGVLTLAWIMDMLTRRQMRHYLGALPLLYTILDQLRVAEVVNRYAPTRSDLSHGTVVVVLVLNRLHAPRALHRVADWMGQTVLVRIMGVEAARFNKDRLARTLSALAPHTQEIWQAVVSRAMAQYNIDLSVIYYDLTAFIMHGDYTGSDLVEFGFAHNTPSNKKKIKDALNVTADGNIPLDYRALPGSKADKATVAENMQRLAALLKKHGRPLHEMLVVGDRAMLDDKLALLYEQKGMRYLAGLEARKKIHRQLLQLTLDSELYRRPLSHQRGRYGYWYRPVAIYFEHNGKETSHQGMVMLSGPMRFALRRTRAKQFRELRQALKEVQAKAGKGKSRYRSPRQVQARAETQLRNSKVGQFVAVKAELEGKKVALSWQVDVPKLKLAQEQDGRYLLVTNDLSLSYEKMFELYRNKDGVEKDFRISKSQLKISPLFLHRDDRIQTMLMLNMLALLAYTILERQARRSGLALTTRRIIESLDNLTVIETQTVDGSSFYRLTPFTQEQVELIAALRRIFPADITPRLLSKDTPTKPGTAPSTQETTISEGG